MSGNKNNKLETPAALDPLLQHSIIKSILKQHAWFISCAPLSSKVIGVSTNVLHNYHIFKLQSVIFKEISINFKVLFYINSVKNWNVLCRRRSNLFLHIGQGFRINCRCWSVNYLSCVPGASGFVLQGSDSASLVTAYAALRPRGGFSHPHQERMIDTFSCIFYFI